jgi:hypothetical protein
VIYSFLRDAEDGEAIMLMESDGQCATVGRKDVDGVLSTICEWRRGRMVPYVARFCRVDAEPDCIKIGYLRFDKKSVRDLIYFLHVLKRKGVSYG